MKIGFCNPFCRYLKPKESEQKDKREQHYCKKYNQRVIHGCFHPSLIKLDICNEEED